MARVRRATAADLATLARLQRLVLPADEPADASVGWWWLAFDEADAPIGFAGMVQSSRWLDAAYLCRAGVVPRARGVGLQARLILAREKTARALGMRRAITDTNDNPASANSLIRRGFRMYSPAQPWAAAGACYWRKRLA